jgi:hypothetical protein
MTLPPIPSVPNVARTVTATLTASIGPVPLGSNFPIFGANEVEVYVQGVLVQPPAYTLSSESGAALPWTDAQVTFAAAQTGSVRVIGARAPYSQEGFTDGGVRARDLNLAFRRHTASTRELWDRILDASGLIDDATAIGTPADGTVTTDKIAAGAVTSQKLAAELAARIDAFDGVASRRVNVGDGGILIGPDGRRRIDIGVTMFNGAFISFDSRVDYTTRPAHGLGAYPVTAGGAAPTGNFPEQFGTDVRTGARKRMKRAQSILGVNLIRVAVEAAMLLSTGYTDPVNSTLYPGEIECLDIIVEEANLLGIDVQIHNARDELTTGQTTTFLTYLANRYKDRANVRICPMNEPEHSAGNIGNINNASVWTTKHTAWVNAIRAAGFDNIILLNGLNYSYSWTALATALQASPFYANLPASNIVIGGHAYPTANNTFLNTSEQSNLTGAFLQYNGFFACVMDEVGEDNLNTGSPNRYDPTLDPTAPLAVDQATIYPPMTQYTRELARFLASRIRFNGLNGVTYTDDFAFFPGLNTPNGLHDDNSIFKRDGTLSAYGTRVRDYFAKDAALALQSNRIAARVAPKLTAGNIFLTLSGGNLIADISDGDGVFINGRVRRIPRNESTGASLITLAATGLTPGSVYALALHDDNDDGVVDAMVATLDGVRTASLTLGNEGVQIVGGLDTRSFVGRALVATGPAWSTASLCIRSWFNRRPRAATSNSAGVAGPGTTAWFEGLTGVPFIVFSDEQPRIRAAGRCTSTNAAYFVTAITVDAGAAGAGGDPIGGGSVSIANDRGGFAVGDYVPTLTEGVHTAKLWAAPETANPLTVMAGSRLTVEI